MGARNTHQLPVKSRSHSRTGSLQSRLQNATQSENDRAAKSMGAKRRNNTGKRKRVRTDYRGILNLSICSFETYFNDSSAKLENKETSLDNFFCLAGSLSDLHNFF